MTAESSDPDEPPRPLRLQRLDRIYVHSAIYFVTACTAARRPLLATPEVHKALLAFAADGPTHGAWIGAFVLMPDHLHLFVALDDTNLTLSALMKSLKNTISKTLRVAGVSSPHWQEGFFDHVLRSSESYDQKWQYVRDNPMRAGLVTRSEDWPFQGEIARARRSAVIDRRYS